MKKLTVILISILLLSCSKDIENITIKGTVYHKKTAKPYKNKDLIIEVECWKYGNSTDESYAEHEKKQVKVDSNGNYEVKFNKGAYANFYIYNHGQSRFIDNSFISSKITRKDLKL